MANTRKTISKSLRFEVFKRDSFTCQYCGKMAPDVVLEIDHIAPVCDGGENTIMNLITSCLECNRGKGARPLSDNQVLKQQQYQLKEINERREQLGLLMEWQKELARFDDEQIDIIDSLIIECSGCSLNDTGRSNIKKHIKKYGMEEMLTSTRLSISQYLKGDTNNINIVVNYIPRICANRQKQKQDPMLQKIQYIKAIIRNRFTIFNERRLADCLKVLVVDEVNFEIICDFAKTVRNWSSFWDSINDIYEGDW